MEKLCLKCGAPIPPGAATGRPASYCGVGCRRAAEHEIKRCDQQLARVESQLSFERQRQPLRDRQDRKWADRRIAAGEAERDRLEARMRLLLAGSDDRGGRA